MLIFSIIFLTLFTSINTFTNYTSLEDFLASWGLNNMCFEKLPTPENVIFHLSEEIFDEYVDFWLESKYDTEDKSSSLSKDGCTVPLNSLTEPQPVYEIGTGLKNPSSISGHLVFENGESFVVSCAGNHLVHGSSTSNPEQAAVTCQSGTTFTSSSWLSRLTILGNIKCEKHISSVETNTGSPCAAGQGFIINIAIQSSERTHVIMEACFNKESLGTLYVKFIQNPENAFHQSHVARPPFSQGRWYPGLSNVDHLYTRNSQKSAIAAVVGDSKANQYITSTNFLVRGHLAAKVDFIFSPSQRATFTFINVAPQWHLFNLGNWKTLEHNLRSHLGETNRRMIVYTGTWDILKLKDDSSISRDIFLEPHSRKIPVPLWFYKVVYEPSTKRGTAFLGLNNPHVELEEATRLPFCTDICNGNKNFRWLTWDKNNVVKGFSICCEINDFRRTVNHLPLEMRVDTLLY